MAWNEREHFSPKYNWIVHMGLNNKNLHNVDRLSLVFVGFNTNRITHILYSYCYFNDTGDMHGVNPHDHNIQKYKQHCEHSSWVIKYLYASVYTNDATSVSTGQTGGHKLVSSSTSPRYEEGVEVGLVQRPGSRCIPFDEWPLCFSSDKLSQERDNRAKETTANPLMR